MVSLESVGLLQMVDVEDAIASKKCVGDVEQVDNPTLNLIDRFRLILAANLGILDEFR